MCPLVHDLDERRVSRWTRSVAWYCGLIEESRPVSLLGGDRTTTSSRVVTTASYIDSASIQPAGQLRTTDVVPPHDLEQARMIRQPKRLGRSRQVPVVPFQGRNQDPSLGFGFECLEGSGPTSARFDHA
jgi:hypothetical protein